MECPTFHLQNIIDFSLPTVKCPSEWTQFIRALASPSPVCGLVHPSENLFRILQRIPQEDITRDLSCMSILQTELPVLFDLLGCITHFPMQSMSPLLKKMIEKSMAPFAIEHSQSELEKTDHISGNVLCELSYFLACPKSESVGCTMSTVRVVELLGAQSRVGVIQPCYQGYSPSTVHMVS